MDTQLLMFQFHWFSEYMMDFFGLLAGYLILKDSIHAQRFLFFAFGISIVAMYGAFMYYSLIEAGTIFPIMFIFFLIVTTLLTIKNYNSIQDVIFFGLGGMLYSQINVLGEALLYNLFNGTYYHLPAPALTIVIVLIAFKREHISL